MVTLEEFRKWALAYPDTEELPHFQNPSFRVKGRIFGTYHIKDNKAMLFLPLEEQSVFCAYQEGVFYPVPGMWGSKGATYISMANVRKDMFKDALQVACTLVANHKQTRRKKS